MQHFSINIIELLLSKNISKEKLPTPRQITWISVILIIEVTKAIFTYFWPNAILPEGSGELTILLKQWGPALLELGLVYYAGYKAPPDPRIETAIKLASK